MLCLMTAQSISLFLFEILLTIVLWRCNIVLDCSYGVQYNALTTVYNSLSSTCGKWKIHVDIYVV